MNYQDRYITSLYWSIQTTTTIGYGDISIISPQEQILAIIVMFLSSFLYGYTLNKTSSIVLDIDTSNL